MKPLISLLFSFFLLATFLGFGSSAWAGDYQTLTKEYVEFLNEHYPNLDLWSHSRGAKAYSELESLEGELQGDFQLPSGSLHELSCSKIVCGGGGGSPCPTCFQGF